MTISNKNVLPDIFLSFQKTYQELETTLTNTTPDSLNPKMAGAINNCFPYIKSSLSDICVGVKALGDKLGVLGGDSFVLLKQQSDNLVSATGNYFNAVSSYNDCATLLQQTREYVSLLNNVLKDLSQATTHLYGDAKFRLGEQFENMENSMVSFFRMAKIKIVAGLVDLTIAIAYSLQYLGLPNGIYANNLLNQDYTLNKPSCHQAVNAIVVDFDDAKNLALKMFN